MQEDTKRASQRLNKETKEAHRARLDAGLQEETYIDPRKVADLEHQLRSLQLAEHNYCNMGMQKGTVYAEILHSMAHTFMLLGKVVPAAVRTGEAAWVASIAQAEKLPKRQQRRIGPPEPPREFVDL